MFLLNKFQKLWRMFFPGIQAQRVKPWFAADGDSTLRLNYDELTKDSVVVDLGGYKGQWAGDIYSKYQCKVFVFEPLGRFYEIIKNRYQINNSISVYQWALGNENKEELIYENADGSSTIRKEGTPSKIVFRKFDEVMNELNIQQIDLLKINIEGGEYDLLEYMLGNKMIQSVKNIQVQFHDFFPDAAERMKNIQNRLKETHVLTYQFEFVWENWKLK
jgi:FkbM family methyltransferase